MCESIIKVRVPFPMTLTLLLKYTLLILVIISYEYKMPVMNNRGLGPVVATLEDLSLNIFASL